jgi:23S rRNA maturation-related 3'-5' exoribonuclease YhaM
MELLKRYEILKRKVIERKDSFDRFLTLLEGETTWLTSPASTRFHLAEEQGLLKHSVGVAETLLRFREALAPAIKEESCVIVGLLHDTGKLGMPGNPLYLPNDNEWMVKNRGIRYNFSSTVVCGFVMVTPYNV